MPPARRTRRPLLALLVLLALLGAGYTARAVQGGGKTDVRPARTSAPAPGTFDGPTPKSTVLATTPDPRTSTTGTSSGVALSTLPEAVRRTVQLIRAGGPYPYQRDGGVFRNDEHLLPAHVTGYYREYTVTTPGEADRGERRVIAGAAGELFYTADHYASFVRIDTAQ